MPIFRVKSVKIYTGQKNLHGYIRGIRDKYQVCQALAWTSAGHNIKWLGHFRLRIMYFQRRTLRAMLFCRPEYGGARLVCWSGLSLASYPLFQALLMMSLQSPGFHCQLSSTDGNWTFWHFLSDFGWLLPARRSWQWATPSWSPCPPRLFLLDLRKPFISRLIFHKWAKQSTNVATLFIVLA